MSRLSFKRCFILVATVCALAAFLASPVHATTIKKLTPEELTAEASAIVKGTVTSVTSQWEQEDTVIYTYVSVSVDEYAKGVGSREITIRQLGGIVGDIGLYIDETPKFEKGEKALLYLRSLSNSYFEVVGLSQGKVAIGAPPECSALASGLLVLLIIVVASLSIFSVAKLQNSNVRHHLPCFLIVSLLSMSLLASEVSAFTLMVPFSNTPFLFWEREPTEMPPFCHWDHRRFALGFRVPYTFIDGTPDTLGLPEFDAVQAAFQTWEDVVPSIIAFERVTPFPGPVPIPYPFARDNWNAISWGLASGAPGADDVQVIRLGQGQPNSVIIDSGANGIVDSVAAGDDTPLILPGQGLANSIIITAGVDGSLDSAPLGDDQVVDNTITSGLNGIAETPANNSPASLFPDDAQVIPIGQGQPNAPAIDSGANGIAGTGAAGDDTQVIPRGQGQPNSIIITAGPNGILESTAYGDDIPNAILGNINSGPNGMAESLANGPLGPPGVNDWLALTPVWFDTATGVILESDILFNDNYVWEIGDNPAPNDGAYDVQTVALHEIGHFIGLMHSAAPAIMRLGVGDDEVDTTLDVDDENGANFLYTPDLGDAPDPYPTKVHTTNPFPDDPATPNVNETQLNGVTLYQPGTGAEHIFGYDPYQFEWLGRSMDNAADECEAKQVNRDLFDDGWLNYPPLIVEGQPFIVTVRISTTGQGGRYAEAGRHLYLNVWFDWKPVNRVWAPDEREIWWEGGPGFTTASSANWQRRFYDGNDIELDFEVTPPLGTGCNQTWVRFRLDWNENVFVDPPADIDKPRPDQNTGEKYAAQFGEVEDYPIHIDCAPPVGNYYYLHADGGLIDLTNPMSTYWQGLCPNETYGIRYHIEKWLDNCNDRLDRCDYIYLERLDTLLKEWYHVENVTVTLFVEKKPHLNESMYIEYEGDIQDFPWNNPVCTQWKEVYPHYCNSYHLKEWYDNGNGYLDYCDQIVLRNKCTNQTAEYHVSGVAIDIIVTRRVPPCPPVASFTEYPEEPRVYQPVYFDASPSLSGYDGDDECPITEYHWGFGDGTTGTGKTIKHVYNKAGDYLVTLTVYAPGIPPYIDPQYVGTNTTDTVQHVKHVIPVGGYSIPMDTYTTAPPPTTYFAILTIIAALFTAVRRKTRRKAK